MGDVRSHESKQEKYYFKAARNSARVSRSNRKLEAPNKESLMTPNNAWVSALTPAGAKVFFFANFLS